GLVDFAINSEDEAVAYLDNGTSVVTFDDFDPSITAFGVFFSASAASTVTVTGAVSTSFAVIANTPTFFGVTEASGITSLSFDVSGGPFVGIDDVRTGSIDTAAIPLPGALGLLLLALAPSEFSAALRDGPHEGARDTSSASRHRRPAVA
ncbi:MAG: hypothetical protein AAFY66_10095, partial [Pseudomonadota bacterium]